MIREIPEKFGREQVSHDGCEVGSLLVFLADPRWLRLGKCFPSTRHSYELRLLGGYAWPSSVLSADPRRSFHEEHILQKTVN